MTPSEIEPATFRFVAQQLNHCATAVPNNIKVFKIKMNVKRKMLSCLGKHWKRKVYILLEQITLFFVSFP